MRTRYKIIEKTNGLKLYAFVIMDNHLHLIASVPELSNTMASLKKFTAKEIITLLKQDNKEWLLSQLAGITNFLKRGFSVSTFQKRVWVIVYRKVRGERSEKHLQREKSA